MHLEGQIWLSVFGHLGAAEAFPVKIRDKTKVEDGQITVQIIRRISMQMIPAFFPSENLCRII